MSAIDFQVYGLATLRAGVISVMAQGYRSDGQPQRVEAEISLTDAPAGERLYLFAASITPRRQVFIQAVSAEKDSFIDDIRLKRVITDVIKKVERLVK